MADRRVEQIRVDPGVAMSRFKQVLAEVFGTYGLPLPNELEVIGGRVMGSC